MNNKMIVQSSDDINNFFENLKIWLSRENCSNTESFQPYLISDIALMGMSHF